MLSFYKWKKNLVLMLLGVMPTMLFLLFFFLTAVKSFTFEGMRFTYFDVTYIAVSIAIAMIVAVVLMIVGSRWLRHAFTNMIEGKGLLTFILDSTGVIGSFNVKVDAPKMSNVFPIKGNPDGIEDLYDTDLQHRLFVPKDAIMTKATTFTKDANNQLVFGEAVDVLVLPKQDEKYDSLFSFENRPVFIFNKIMGKFLSRDALAKYEKDIEIKHNALNILNKLQGTHRDFLHFARYVGENIKPEKKGLFGGKPWVKYVIIAAVVGMIIMIMLMFVPGLLNAGSRLSFPFIKVI